MFGKEWVCGFGVDVGVCMGLTKRVGKEGGTEGAACKVLKVFFLVCSSVVCTIHDGWSRRRSEDSITCYLILSVLQFLISC